MDPEPGAANTGRGSGDAGPGAAIAREDASGTGAALPRDDAAAGTGAAGGGHGRTPQRDALRQARLRGDGYDRTIVVPFCPESRLSGIHDRGFQTSLWYHRTVTVPAAWVDRRVLVHFGAVDYEAHIYLDGACVGRHLGGSSSFAVDLGRLDPTRAYHLVVHAVDDPRSRRQASGKQSHRPESHHVVYTRVSGIWQSVWLEAVPERRLVDVQHAADPHQGRLALTPRFAGVRAEDSWHARLLADGHTVAEAEGAAIPGVPLTLETPHPRPWTPDDPFLYDLVLELRDRDGTVLDRVASYAGLRSLAIDGGRLLLNGSPFYPRLVLDQGYWPEGVWTAPSDAALRRDIELAREAGFNGARLHQKAFEERYHYWADRLGFLTWGESASWGFDERDPEAARRFAREWAELLERDRNHPSIVAWTPFNETDPGLNADAHRRLVEDTVALTRALDPGRPINDCSGWVHVRTDLWTVHAYEQDPEALRRQLAPPPPVPFRNEPAREPAWQGQPYLVDEFGGIKWVPQGEDERAVDWGYGEDPRDEAAFFDRLERQVAVLLSLPHVAGYCYTQLTDVEQERNGLYNEDRSPKFDARRLRAIFGREPAAAEGAAESGASAPDGR